MWGELLHIQSLNELKKMFEELLVLCDGCFSLCFVFQVSIIGFWNVGTASRCQTAKIVCFAEVIEIVFYEAHCFCFKAILGSGGHCVGSFVECQQKFVVVFWGVINFLRWLTEIFASFYIASDVGVYVMSRALMFWIENWFYTEHAALTG